MLEISATNELIDRAEAALPELEAALTACLERFHHEVHPSDAVTVGRSR